MNLTEKQKNILKVVRSNKLFLEILKDILPENESPPMKQGKNGLILAASKDDEGCQYLLNHENEKIRNLIVARLAAKSWNTHIKRVDNLINQAKVNNGMIGAPLSYYSAHTGRWGGTEGINLQNLGGRGRAGQGTHELIKAVRQMLISPDGYIFGKGDLAQIEARVLAWLAGQDDLVQGFADGEDIYSQFAMTLFKSVVRKARQSDPPPVKKQLTIYRGFGKDAILGCGYGMGAQKFYDRCYVNPDLKPLFDSGEYTLGFIKKLIDTYRTTYSKIPEFWQTVEKAWKFATKYPRRGAWEYFIPGKKTVGTFNGVEIVNSSPLTPHLQFYHQDRATYITLPSGRYLRYPHATVDRKGQAKYRWGHLWGGSITENIVQAVARDIFAEALLRFDNIVTHTHDDIVCLLEDESQLQDMLDKMCIVPSWASGLPIAAEGSCSKRYGGNKSLETTEWQ